MFEPGNQLPACWCWFPQILLLWVQMVWVLSWGFEGQPDRPTSSISVEHVDRLQCKQALAVCALVEDRDGLSFFHHHLSSDWAKGQIWIVSRTE